MCWTSPSYARSFYGCSTRVGDRTGLLPCRGRIDVYVGSLQETKNEARKRQNDRRKSTDAVEKVAARCCHSTGRKIDLSDRPISRSEAYVEGKATLENLANSSTPTFSTTSTLTRHSALCSSIVRFSHHQIQALNPTRRLVRSGFSFVGFHVTLCNRVSSPQRRSAILDFTM